MRPIVLAILAVVAIILFWVLSQGSYKDSSVYILSLISTALCGYLVADGLFNNAKKKWHIQRETHTQEVTQLNNDLDILKTQIKGMPPHSEIDALHNNFAAAIADNDKLKSEIATHAIVIQQKNSDFAGLRNSHNQLLADLSKTQGALADRDAAIKKNQETFHQLGLVVDGLHAEHDKMQSDVAAKDATILKNQETFKQLGLVVDGLHAEHDAMQSDIAAKNATILKNQETFKQLGLVVDGLHAEHDAMQSDIAAKNATILKNQDAFHQLEIVVAGLNAEHEKLQNTLLSQDAVQQKLLSDLGAANATLNEYRSAIKELHGLIADREKEETQLKADLVTRESEIATLKNELATKDAAVIQHQNTVIALNDAVDKMKHEHEANEVQRQGELSQVRKTLEETRTQLVGISDENQKLRVTPPVISKTTRDIVEAPTEDTKFLSEDKSIGAVKSHRTRAIDEDDSIKIVPATPQPVPVSDTIVIATPIATTTSVVVVATPTPEPEPTPIVVTVAPVAPVVVQNEAVKIIPSDDLKIIEGIGPKIEQVLNAAGITTWHELSHTDPEKLREILSDAGKRFNANDPSTWPEQARLLANGEMEKFKAYTDFLISGRVPKA